MDILGYITLYVKITALLKDEKHDLYFKYCDEISTVPTDDDFSKVLNLFKYLTEKFEMEVISAEFCTAEEYDSHSDYEDITFSFDKNEDGSIIVHEVKECNSGEK